MTTAPPNHHAGHPGFSGVSGHIAAIGFLFGRHRAADLAIELAELTGHDRIVDIGCGPGVAVARADAIGAHAIGVDPSSAMLRVARARWWRRSDVSWREGVAEALPVDDRWASVVWSLSTVHHWQDIDGGLAEIVRVLEPGGQLVITERRIADPTAAGVAGHGWTTDQADAFTAACTNHGFTDARRREHAGRPAIVSVSALAPLR